MPTSTHDTDTITVWLPGKYWVATAKGPMRYRDWLRLEVKRHRRNGSKVKIVSAPMGKASKRLGRHAPDGLAYAMAFK